MSLLLGLIYLSSCDKDVHQDESGLTVTLKMTTDDAVSSVRLWIYQESGALVKEYSYKSVNELASDRFQLPAGNYVLVAANNLVTPFSVKDAAGDAKAYEDLLFTLDDASASPIHAHYGTKTVTVHEGETSLVQVDMSRVLAELQFTIKGVPADVTEVEAYVKNAAQGFYPAMNRLTPETAPAYLGKVRPQDGVISFPLIRVMPVVTPTESRAVSDIPTLLEFNFKYSDNTSIHFEAEAPEMQNGGTYTPEVVFEVFQPGVTIRITDINGWGVGETTGGEILNPSN
ncbi:hypothetical protein Bache_3241 [Bacteroides helcogenes P 36-108]|uniref:Lipoprotein n=2 Tax=Bacteroides helcogenes TaxID=290053 RepID=E6SSB4_BACT6|nr:hypothetical protein Bache_3241 [Bacteroides helcogenes P 36-108]